MSSFSDFPLRPELQVNLASLGFKSPTAVQQLTLEPALAGRDLIARAKTGSGKTLAFGLGLLNKLDVKRFRVQALVLCPTRELADQVANELRKLARQLPNVKILTLCGGQPMGPQIGSLEHGAHIIVGTPGRIDDHVRKGRLALNNVETLVLDEADRMLDMGFRDVLDELISLTPQSRQSLLFSATYPDGVADIAKRYLSNMLSLEVESESNNTNIEQRFYQISHGSDRFDAVMRLLHELRPSSAILFCHTKKEVAECAELLCEQDVEALPLQGDMDQRDRDRTLIRFANHSATILVATDVAARGLDIDNVDLVINYQLSRDAEVHVHRVGRTGRGEEKGVACTIFTEREQYKLEELNRIRGQEAEMWELPHVSVLDEPLAKPSMHTLQLDGGKKQKIRPGDIVGALCGDKTLSVDDLGKIKIEPMSSFVAVKRKQAKKALERLKNGKIKGRQLKARLLRR
ncbi:ATP-dependent RNA helicase DbpA [Agaribacterium sp. ZY112]|uniref:ATP-dependent RNA helicase DbpA n=1 Tax=Agaribacterium sp. ZY112 TaxID=3233574 RepID=UPI0035239850